MRGSDGHNGATAGFVKEAPRSAKLGVLAWVIDRNDRDFTPFLRIGAQRR